VDTKYRAADFFNVWVNICTQRRDALLDCWVNSPVFTSRIFSEPNCIIEAIASSLNLRSYCGYYCLDAILFERDLDLVPEILVGTTWVRRIRIAFEHENHFDSGLFQEVSHLMITDCDLRVVVTYPANGDELGTQLKYLHRIIAETDRTDHIAQSEGFLFIAGWRDAHAANIEWSGFVYDRTEWRPQIYSPPR
jgi:hypothetical protein